MAETTEITAPAPGTFWRRPDPESDPFVQPGDRVEAGAVVGLLEVMKQFLDITASATGEVGEFQAQDGVAVTAGQVVVSVS